MEPTVTIRDGDSVGTSGNMNGMQRMTLAVTTCWNTVHWSWKYNKRVIRTAGFFLEKYAALTGNNVDQKASAQLNWNNNLRIYQFYQTLLNAAELIVRGAGTGNAKEYLNRVRNHCGLKGRSGTSMDNIIKERHLEFVGEGKRYWDLIRTRKRSVLVPDRYGYRTNVEQQQEVSMYSAK